MPPVGDVKDERECQQRDRTSLSQINHVLAHSAVFFTKRPCSSRGACAVFTASRYFRLI